MFGSAGHGQHLVKRPRGSGRAHLPAWCYFQTNSPVGAQSRYLPYSRPSWRMSWHVVNGCDRTCTVLSVTGDAVLGGEGGGGDRGAARLPGTSKEALRNVVALPNRRTKFGNHADEGDGDHER